MGCCGNQRQRQYARQSIGKDGVPLHPPMQDVSPGKRQDVIFQYVGKTGLTAIGPVSGIRYRFIGPGVTLSVDPRDRLALGKIPHLRQVQSSH